MAHPRRRAATLLLALCGLAAPALADDAVAAPQPRTGVLLLRTGEVDTATRTNLLPAARAFKAGVPYVLVFSGPMTPDRRAALDNAGVVLSEFLPTDSFAAFLGKATPAALRALPGLLGVYDVDAAWKVSPTLGQAKAESGELKAVEARGKRAVTISLFAGASPDAALAAMQAVAGFELLSFSDEGGAWAVTAAVVPGSEAALAAIDAVHFIDDAPEFTARNTTVRWIVQSNLANQTPLYTRGLNGTGEILGLIDGLPEITHCSLLDPVNPVGPLHRKVQAINNGSFANGHGTHVAGTLLGDAGASDDTRGVAYGARMVFNTYPSLSESSIFDRFNLHRTQGAFVHSNSWGNERTTAYDVTARAVDNFLWQHDDNLLVFAVSDGSLIKNPENAKNLLAVSASGDAGSQNSWCVGGRGPTSDARRKPEVLAPGCGIQSSDSLSPCGTVGMTGTSMACPAVAGVTALVRQYFTLGYYPSGAPNGPDAFTPSGALLKAVVVNGAVDMTGVSGFPNTTEGWGRVLADNALYFPGDARKLLVTQAFNSAGGALQTGQASILRFRVVSDAMPLKITMAYSDAPAAVSVSLAPVNNLDLSVAALGGATYLGNSFSGGVSAVGGSPDTINNLEQTLIPGPQAGAWIARIDAAAVNVGPQGFALVVTGDVETLCPADFNGDGFVDFFDYDSFVTAFDVGDQFSDFNADGFIDFFDYDGYVEAFETGC